MLGVSLAVAHAAAAVRGEELYVHLNRLWRERLAPGEPAEPVLPMPMVNMISGGLHAGANLDFQDFLFIPLGCPELQRGARDHGLRLPRARRDPEEEGARSRPGRRRGRVRPQAPDQRPGRRSSSSRPAWPASSRSAATSAIALDVAASHFYDAETGTYHLSATGDEVLDTAGMIALLEHWVKQYPIVSIEDGLAEDDWDGWTALTARLGGSVQLIGDDLFATQSERLRQGIERGAANAILIKLNQVGTLSETLDTLHLARRHGYRTIVSARSGETEDTTIADLAVATAAGQIKIGSVARSERLAKYNRLLADRGPPRRQGPLRGPCGARSVKSAGIDPDTPGTGWCPTRTWTRAPRLWYSCRRYLAGNVRDCRREA